MGIVSRLLGVSSKTKSSGKHTVGDIRSTYASILDNHSLGPSQVADINELPYSKDKIKNSLLATIPLTSDPIERQKAAEAFLLLAYWQPNVGKHRVGLTGGSFSSIPESVKKAMADMKEWEEWEPIVMAEMEQLQNEVNDVLEKYHDSENS